MIYDIRSKYFQQYLSNNNNSELGSFGSVLDSVNLDSLITNH